MSDFRTNIRNAIEALVKVGYNQSDALDLIWRDSPRLFLKFFTSNDEDSSGYYRIDVNDPVIVSITEAVDDELRHKGVIVNRDEVDYLMSNKKITTIKFVRALTGWGLKESKDFVEGMTKHLTEAQHKHLSAMFGPQLVRDTTYEGSMDNMMDSLRI